MLEEIIFGPAERLKFGHPRTSQYRCTDGQAAAALTTLADCPWVCYFSSLLNPNEAILLVPGLASRHDPDRPNWLTGTRTAELISKALMRCFLAIDLPSALKDAICSATIGARRALGPDIVRWIPPQNIHLTLKFLGDTAATSLEHIRSALEAEVPHFKHFNLGLNGLGAFPNAKRPRVLWIGLEAPAALISLQHELDMATSRLGYASEERGFSPHLTIGRVRPNVSTAGVLSIRQVLEGAPVGWLGTLPVGAVHLYKSELLPAGSVYTRLHTVQMPAG